jgi:hypothetical protein
MIDRKIKDDSSHVERKEITYRDDVMRKKGEILEFN